MQLERYIPPLVGSAMPGKAGGTAFHLQSFGKEPEEEAPLPPPPPSFSEAEMKQAEQDGYRKGFGEGEKEGKLIAQSAQAQADRAICDVLEPLTGNIQKLFDDYNAFVSTQKAALPPVALAIARKVAGKSLEGDPLPVIEQAVTACLDQLLGEPSITITVHESIATALETRIGEYFAGSQDPGEINIEGDADIAPTDCRIEWKKGGMARDTARLWQEMETIIQGIVAGALHEHHDITALTEDEQQAKKTSAQEETITQEDSNDTPALHTETEQNTDSQNTTANETANEGDVP